MGRQLMWLLLLASLGIPAAQPVRVRVEDLFDTVKSANYDYRVRPNFNGDPVVVYCAVDIIEFGSIEESTMQYQIVIFQKMAWDDPRLAHDFGNSSWVDLGNHLTSSIWRPRLHYSNEKKGNFHKITTQNELLRIYSNGTIIYSVRLSLTLSCPMDLHIFPMDTQACFIDIESSHPQLCDCLLGIDSRDAQQRIDFNTNAWGIEDSSTTDDLEFLWAEPNPVSFSDSISLREFSMRPRITTTNGAKNYSLGDMGIFGTFSHISAKFFLRREIGFYVIEIYVPSTLIIIISWLSFWMKADAIPARIALGITTVLTMTTQISGSRFSLPKLSYITAMDIWMTTCLVFVFSALLESVLAAVWERDKRERLGELTAAVQQGGKEKILTESREKQCPLDVVSRVFFPLAFALFHVAYWLVFLVFLQTDE